jgi:hypothetical protein
MADLLLLITLLVAVGALLGLVRLCDRIVGDDPPTTAPATAPPGASDPAASTSSQVAR